MPTSIYFISIKLTLVGSLGLNALYPEGLVLWVLLVKLPYLFASYEEICLRLLILKEHIVSSKSEAITAPHADRTV